MHLLARARHEGQGRRSSACPERVLRSEQDSSSREFKAFRYVIVGAGSAASEAVKAIRLIDQTGEILLIGDTVHKTLPFHRQSLSVSQSPSPTRHGNDNYSPVIDFSDVVDDTDLANAPKDPLLTHYRHLHAKKIEVNSHRVTLTDGQVFEYDSLLIATGGSPRTPPCFQGVQGNFMTFKTVKDYRELKEVCKKVKSVCVIGGGLLGSELASSIAYIGIKVTQVFTGPGIYSKLLPRYLSDYVTDEFKKRGIEVKSRTVVDTKQNGSSHTLILDNGETVESEFTVICGGTQPNVEIAKSAGLPIHSEDGGLIVEPTLEVVPDVYAAGDIISWKDPIFKVHRRVDHHDHALHSGEIAGKNMCGQVIEYNHQPFFWSDLGFFAFEAVGLISSQLQTVGVWQRRPSNENDTSYQRPIVLQGSDTPPHGIEYNKGYVYYLQGKFIVGILLVGMFGKLEQARAMIVQRRITISNPEDCENLMSFL